MPMSTATSERKRSSNPRGRPAAAEAGDIRMAILDAAEVLFAHKGYAATSVREIAETVEVTPAMVHYYFGSKLALLRQVLERTLEPLAATIVRMREARHAPPREIAGLLLRMLREHPALPILMVREVMLPGGQMQEHFLEHLAPRLGGALPGLLGREQAAGRIAADVDPNIAALVLISLCLFPFIARNVAEPGLRIAYDADGLGRLEQHIGRLFEEGFAA